jgi:hypothetical protein
MGRRTSRSSISVALKSVSLIEGWRHAVRCYESKQHVSFFPETTGRVRVPLKIESMMNSFWSEKNTRSDAGKVLTMKNTSK